MSRDGQRSWLVEGEAGGEDGLRAATIPALFAVGETPSRAFVPCPRNPPHVPLRPVPCECAVLASPSSETTVGSETGNPVNGVELL